MSDDYLLQAVTGALEGFGKVYIPRQQAKYEDELSRNRKAEELSLEEASYKRRKQAESEIELGQLPAIEASKIRIAQASPIQILDGSGQVIGSAPKGSKFLPTPKGGGDPRQDAKKPEAIKSAQEALANLEALEKEASDILGSKNLSLATGGTAWIGKIPGTPARDIRARIETLKAKTSFSTLQAMREASKTGGALGQVSDNELRLLQNAISSLDTGQSDEGFKDSLQRLIDYTVGAKQRIKEGYYSTYGEELQGSAPPPSDGRKPLGAFYKGGK